MPAQDTRSPTGGLYIIWFSDTHYYGGRTSNFTARWAEHLRRLKKGVHWNPYVQSTWAKHKRFEPQVLLALESDHVVAEQKWIDANLGAPGCLNLSCRADAPSMKGANHSEETRLKMRQAAMGRKNSPEARQKMSDAKAGKSSGRAGERHSPQAKEKMSARHTGKKLSEETKARMRAAQQKRRDLEATTA